MPDQILAGAPPSVAASATQAKSATDYWGRKLPNTPRDFIFGYGSLIDTPSRNTTCAKPIPAIPARLSAAFGYVRAWVDRSASGFTALGLRRPRDGERAGTANGVLYPADETEMTQFDHRELGYARVAVAADMLEAVSWQSLPQHGSIWTYVPLDDQDGPTAASPDFPLLQSYIDVFLEGALEYGSAFAHEAIETTQDWSAYWLNDRALARRPWVCDEHYAETDQLLSTVHPASVHFGDRLFAEPFAACYLLLRTSTPNASMSAV